MLSVFDYIMIVFYFGFIASLGIIFKRLCRGSTDYFAGGLKMNWWLLGASSFIANFSSWTFTGAAGIAYTYGVVFFSVYLVDIVGFTVSMLWFAPRFRRLRLVTAMDAVRLRFGRFNEQLYTWLHVLTGFVGGAVWLVGLSIILSTVFQAPQVPVIVVCGLTILFMALLGGNWAVVASDFIQVLLLMVTTVVAAVLTVKHVGGIGSLISRLPDTHWEMFKPLGSIKYDWLYVVTALLFGVYQKNSIVFGAAKYIAAKDDTHAKKSVWIPLIGYILLPIVWFIPAVAARLIVPNLAETYAGFNVPAEASYIATCVAVLPQGLLGLLVAGLFAATMSSMDTSLNKSAGFLVKNFYQPIFRKHASDRELLHAGQVATLVCGVIVIFGAVLMATRSKVSLFEAFLYLNAYIQAPLIVALFMGMLVKRTPAWAGWATILFGCSFSVLLFDVVPTEAAKGMLIPLLGETVYSYLITNKFTLTNLLTVPLTTLFFVGTRLFFKERKYNRAYMADVAEFTRRTKTPVDFEAEVGGDNTAEQARIMGVLSMVYGGFIGMAVVVPNPASGRLAIAFCSAVMLLIGLGLLRYSRRSESFSTRP